QGDDLPGADLEVESVERPDVAVALVHAGEADRGAGRGGGGVLGGGSCGGHGSRLRAAGPSPQSPQSPRAHDSRHAPWGAGYSGSVLIRQVRPFDAATGGAPDAPVDLRIRDGVIAELAAGLSPAPGEEVLDGGGALATPGLWDQHVHSGQLAQAHARLDTSGAGSVGVILELVRAELASRRETAVDPVQALI